MMIMVLGVGRDLYTNPYPFEDWSYMYSHNDIEPPMIMMQALVA